MGFRFRKSIKLMPGVKINLSKSGISTSLGGRGATVNISKRGTRTTLGIPGTGITHVSTSKANSTVRNATGSNQTMEFEDQVQQLPEALEFQLRHHPTIEFESHTGNQVHLVQNDFNVSLHINHPDAPQNLKLVSVDHDEIGCLLIAHDSTKVRCDDQIAISASEMLSFVTSNKENARSVTIHNILTGTGLVLKAVITIMVVLASVALMVLGVLASVLMAFGSGRRR